MGNCVEKVQVSKLRHEFQNRFAVLMNHVDNEENFERLSAANVAKFGFQKIVGLGKPMISGTCGQVLPEYFFTGMTRNSKL